jgi:hypothetical protein
MNNHEAQLLLTGANVVTDPEDHRPPIEIAEFLGLVVLGDTEVSVNTDQS